MRHTQLTRRASSVVITVLTLLLVASGIPTLAMAAVAEELSSSPVIEVGEQDARDADWVARNVAQGLAGEDAHAKLIALWDLLAAVEVTDERNDTNESAEAVNVSSAACDALEGRASTPVGIAHAFALVAGELGWECQEVCDDEGRSLVRLAIDDKVLDLDVASGEPGQYPWRESNGEGQDQPDENTSETDVQDRDFPEESFTTIGEQSGTAQEGAGEQEGTKEGSGKSSNANANTSTNMTGDKPGQTGDAKQDVSVAVAPSVGTRKTSGVATDDAAQAEAAPAAVSYRVHVQTHGDQAWRADGAAAGTTGQAKRLEALWLRLGPGAPAAGGVQYRTHVQGIGWQGWREDGQESGTHGQSRRLEAVQVRLTGDIARTHDVWYRVHAQTYGWMGWARDGETAGTAGLSKRLEAIQVVLVAKGAQAPSNAGRNVASAFIGRESVMVRAHVQTYGWMREVGNGEVAGTTGQSKRVEALRLSLAGVSVPGGIEACAHVQGIGWQPWRAGEAGTTGQSRRVEAIRLRLTGEAASVYDVWYRVHVQNGGWMAWTCNGESAGTQGLSTRVEAVQVQLVRKGAGAPSSSGQSLSTPFVGSQTMSYRVRGNGAWQSWRANGATAGGGGITVTGIEATLGGDLPGSVIYAAHVSRVGWLREVANGATAASGTGTVEGFTMRLGGQASSLFNVWYRGYVRGKGWMGWAKNGQKAGSEGCGLALEAIEVCLVSKVRGAPGSTNAPLYDSLERTLSGLTLEQRIAQLFVVTPEQLTGGGTVTSADGTLTGALARRPVGGLIYFGANLKNPSQTRSMLSGTQNAVRNACGVPVLQCVDEEGGAVARVAQNPAFGVANVGNMASIGASGSASRAQQAAETMGTYLRQLGFNVDLAPVADINSGQGDAMDRRSFGGSPQLVSSMVQAQVRGFANTGTLCAAKHFPGSGSTEGDAHYTRVFCNKTTDQLLSWDLIPFRGAIDQGVPMVMVGHINCTKFANGYSLPASLNPAIINGLLRGTLGYDGLVITDALGMGAVQGVCGDSQQGVRAIQAGADLILMPSDFNQAYDGLLNAVRSGQVSEARINESVRRILRAKATL